MNVIANKIIREFNATTEITKTDCGVFLSVIPNRGAGQGGRVRNLHNINLCLQQLAVQKKQGDVSPSALGFFPFRGIKGVTQARD